MIARYGGAKERWARRAAFALVAVATGLTALHFQQVEKPHKRYRSVSAQMPRNVAAELAHCQAVRMATPQNQRCLAAWRAQQNHFFSNRPVRSRTTAATTFANSTVKTKKTSDLPEASATGAKAVPPKSGAPYAPSWPTAPG